MKIKLCISLLALLSVTACARDGFDDATTSSSEEDTQIVEDITGNGEELVEEIARINTSIKEITSENMGIYYTMPEDVPFAEDIEAIMQEVSTAYDMDVAGASLELFDNISLNNGEVFSIYYEGMYKNDELPNGREILFGLSFNIATGSQIPTSTWMEKDELATFLMNEQSNFMDVSDEYIAGIREEIQNMGYDRLVDIIHVTNEQDNIDQLLTFSYVLKEDEILFLLPLSGENEDYAKITMPFQV